MADFVKLSIFGTVFEVTTRYVDLQTVGMGAFGLVCSAKDQLTGANVGIKKILKPFSTLVLSKRTYRELKLLKHLKHENIISLSDIFISPLEDIYFVTELLGTDLHRLLTSRPLEKQFIQYFLYQILKPSNILVNENCDLKICDFGLARVQDPQMTGYVPTRYYRAPDIMLTWQKYDVAAAPSDDVIQTIGSENTLSFVQSLQKRDKVPFSQKFTNAEPECNNTTMYLNLKERNFMRCRHQLAD
ncbi:kinase-like domain-containing protein [Gigaspora rosea]|uniref:Kinase-like domain-containing protein n=1 Tax=Gigaspora rosea TaxID=44941 RepID=A0A397V7Q0_9GLOM|nr:kinase-like domain-containing protein [Gigaspora rosea]